jgi:hypothetical protein
MKNCPVCAELFHTEGHAKADKHDEANPRYSYFFERDYKIQ